MSAFICDHEHLNAILNGLIFNTRGDAGPYLPRPTTGKLEQLTRKNAVIFGQEMLELNVLGVHTRYPNCDVNNLPGPINLSMEFKFKIVLPTPTAVQTIKLIKCFSYQTCELDNWNTHPCRIFTLEAINTMCSHLHGYDEANWEHQGQGTLV